MDIQIPSPQTTLTILFGASEWPESPDFPGSLAFANAMSRFKSYLFDPYGFGLPKENALDLFDESSSPHVIDRKIRQFLDSKIAEMKSTGNGAKDLLLYFVGHGGFVGRNSDYYLAIRCTSTEDARLSGIPMESLASTLTDKARYLRRIIILDCCYAAAAFTSFQAEGPAKLGIDQTFRAFEKQAKTVGKGTTLLCSSGKTVASQIAQDQSYTMFSKALLQVLFMGDERRQEQHYFSLREVADLTEEVITRELEGKAPRPEIHSPDQKEGDVADIPFFPNPRFKTHSTSIGQCPACGAKSRSGAAFCSRCGHRLLQPTLAPQRSASVSTPPRLEKVRRREDLPLITGKGQYVSDIRRPGMLYACFLRSPYSHARIVGIDTNEAQAHHGVVRIVTGAETSHLGKFPTRFESQLQLAPQPCLASGTVNYYGEPVAAVVAESEESAWDAMDTIVVDYEPLASFMMELERPLHQSNKQGDIAIIDEKTGGDVEKGFAQADTVVSLRLVQPRLAPAPLEGRAILAEGHSDGTLSVWISHQSPWLARLQLAQILNIPSERIKLTIPHVGGAFGGKMRLCGEEAVTAFLAYTLQRPVRWLGESAPEQFVSMGDGRGMVANMEAAVRGDGTIRALKAEIFADLGAYPDDLRLLNLRSTAEMISGCYAIPAIKTTIKGVKTNTVPSGTYQGAGGTEACYFIERVVEAIARKLVLDAVEVRKRNFIQPGAFPYTTATGMTYDSGAYASALDLLLTKANYRALRAEQAHLREQAQYMGIGLCTCVERVGGGEHGIGGQLDSAYAPDGKIIVENALVDSGRGHTTTFPFSAHLAVVQVDPETGEVRVQRYMVVDDSGRVLDPVLMEDQIHGSIAQGIGQALYEEVVYAEDGLLLTSTFVDYALPKIEDLPTFEVAYTETPSPLNIPDAKGVGTFGCAGASPAVTNAVLDALAPLGVTALDIPLTREKVWQALHKKP